MYQTSVIDRPRLSNANWTLRTAAVMPMIAGPLLDKQMNASALQTMSFHSSSLLAETSAELSLNDSGLSSSATRRRLLIRLQSAFAAISTLNGDVGGLCNRTL